MLGYTHLVYGIGSAMLFVNPGDRLGLLKAAAGGALGGMICDVDTKPGRFLRDTLYSGEIALGVAAVSMILDWKMKTGICRYVLSHWGESSVLGLLGFSLCCVFGMLTKHRTFSHSLLALLLLSISLNAFCAPLVLSFQIGFLSHLALDLLNKRDVFLLFPIPKGFKLNLFHSGKLANHILLLLGTAGLIFLFWEKS